MRLPGVKRGESSGIKIIEGSPELAQPRGLQLPAMTKTRRSLQRPVISGLIVFGNLDGIFRASEIATAAFQFVVAVRKDKFAALSFSNEDLANRAAIVDRRGQRCLNQVRHYAS